MKKKLIALAGAAILGVAVLIFVTNSVNGGVAVAEDERFRIKGSTLIQYLGTDTFVSIPDTVTTIGEEAFAGNETLTGIEIPDSVSVISYNSFKDCTALKDVIIPDTVTKVGPGAFEGCTALEIAEIGKGVSSWGTGVFTNCDALGKVIVDKDNDYLTEYNGAIYNGNMTMLYQVLPDREGENYVMPDTVEKIDTYAFWNMQNVKNILLSEKVETIPSYALSNLNSVENVVIRDNVTTIERGAFANSSNLKQVRVPVSAKNIDKTAFSNCPQLKIFTQKGSYIESYCKKREIPVIYKKEYPVDFMDSNVGLDEKPNVDGDGSVADNDSNTVIVDDSNDNDASHKTDNDAVNDKIEDEIYHNTEDDTYQEFRPTGGYVHPLDVPENDDVVGKTVIVAGNAVVLMNNTEGVVYNGDEVEKNNIEASETEIVEEQTSQTTDGANNDDAEESETGYSEPESSESVQMDETHTSNEDSNKETIIPQREYYKKSDLTQYEIEKSVVEIGRQAFSESGLKEIVIPDNVKTISYGAFFGCFNLENVKISDKVESIETKAFEGTAWLNNWFEEKSESEEDDFLIAGDGILIAYKGNSSKVDIPNMVKQIGPEAFKGHTEITSVYIPDSVTRICADAFRNCSSLDELSGCEGLETIIRGAFYGTKISENDI